MRPRADTLASVMWLATRRRRVSGVRFHVLGCFVRICLHCNCGSTMQTRNYVNLFDTEMTHGSLKLSLDVGILRREGDEKLLTHSLKIKK